GTHLAVVALGATLIMLITGLGTGLAAAGVTADAGLIPDVMFSHLATLPAVLAVLGITAAFFGVAPRFMAIIGWLLVAVRGIVDLFADLVALPTLFRGLSPLWHLATVPVEAFQLTRVVVLVGIAIVAVGVGLAGFHRREINVVWRGASSAAFYGHRYDTLEEKQYTSHQRASMSESQQPMHPGPVHPETSGEDRSARLAVTVFPAIIIAAFLIGFFFPDQTAPLANFTSLALGIIMFAMGVTLTIPDFALVAKRPLPVLLGVISQYVIMPAIALGLIVAFQLPTELAIGVILVGCAPGGTSSNVITYLSKGDVALSVTMT